MTLNDLPAINACLNGLSAIWLTAGYWFIRRRRNREAHRKCMLAAFVTSTLFLACYLTYHGYRAWYLHQGPTKFTGPGWCRPIYFFILTTHSALAAAIVPLALLTLRQAFKQRFDQHKKIARWTWPLWMYVSVTGVLIYLLLYQIFPRPAGS